MKTLKKLFSVLAVVAMILTMSVNANAATVTVRDGDDHEYVAYQVLTGTQEANDASLGTPTWGNGIDSASFITKLTEKLSWTITDGASFAEKLSGCADNSAEAEAVAKLAYAAKNDANKIALKAGENELAAGYYLIVDVTAIKDGDEDAKNAALLQVTNKGEGDIVIGAKSSIPSVDKFVKRDGAWSKFEDTTRGGLVEMKVEATIPSMRYYTTYPITFIDDATGFTGLNIVSVKITGKKGGEVVVNQGEGGYVLAGTAPDFTLTISDVKSLCGTTINTNEEVKVVVEYTTNLAADATIGSTGNPNKVKLTYNANPDGSENVNTKEKEVKVYTFEIEGTKVDGTNTGKKLSGAVFALKKSNTEYYKIDDNGAVTWVATAAAADKFTSVADTGLFGPFAGLDAGTYLLEEITPPAGYNKAADQEVIIAPTYENNVLVTDGSGNDTAATDGKIEVTVLNNKGATLPETGGIGTTMFYVIGAALVIGAGVVLVSKKRMATK